VLDVKQNLLMQWIFLLRWDLIIVNTIIHIS
jgi:hypothetical protein